MGAALVLEPVLDTTTSTGALLAVDIAYPLGDVLLLAVVAGVFGLTGWRPGLAWALFAAGLAATALADALYLVMQARGSYEEGGPIDALWPASALLLAGAAWSGLRRPEPRAEPATGPLALPLVCGAAALGVLAIGAAGATNLPALLLALAALLMILARTTLTLRENGQMLAESRRRASRDALTGLLNHGAFHERLAQEVVRARRHCRELCLAVLDVDHFKAVNDAHGHQAGDRALVELARRLRELARSADHVGRLGGEEFAWILPETDGDSGLLAGERLRDAIADEPIPGVGRMTVSVGVCHLAEADSAADLFRLADGALYWAKAQGRNLCLRYSPHTTKALSAQEHLSRLEHGHAVVGVRALARAVDAKDPSTRRHSERVAGLARELALADGWDRDRAELLHEAGLLHDIGKIGVSDAILLESGPLGASQTAALRRHAALGGQIVSGVLTSEQVT